MFVHGCYWHGCPEYYTSPKSHAAYWTDKIQRNIERDRETVAILRAAGWQPITVWEHEAIDEAAERVVVAIGETWPI